MHSWFYILLASALVSTCTVCAQIEATPECNHLTYELVMKRITDVTYHTHATVRDAYLKTKDYVDDYKKQIDGKLDSMDMKLTQMQNRLLTISTQLTALTGIAA